MLDLQNLTHKTVVTRSSAWITLTFAWLIVAGLVGFAVFLLASNRRESAAGVLVLVGFVALILSPLLIGLFQRVRRNSYDVTIFHYRHGGQSAFSVFNNKPSRQEAQDFIQQLTKEIERAAPFEDKGEGLADQLGRLDALRSRGVLSEEEFASAKQRLLKLGVEEKRIGF